MNYHIFGEPETRRKSFLSSARTKRRKNVETNRVPFNAESLVEAAPMPSQRNNVCCVFSLDMLTINANKYYNECSPMFCAFFSASRAAAAVFVFAFVAIHAGRKFQCLSIYLSGISGNFFLSVSALAAFAPFESVRCTLCSMLSHSRAQQKPFDTQNVVSSAALRPTLTSLPAQWELLPCKLQF